MTDQRRPAQPAGDELNSTGPATGPPAPAPDDDIVDAELVTEVPNADSTSTEPTTSPAAASPSAAAPASDGPVPVSPTGAWLPPTPAFDYTDAGVPTLDFVRDKIENRLGTATASAELAEEERKRSEAARAVTSAERERAAEVARRERDRAAEAARLQREQAAADRLADIRRSLHPEPAPDQPPASTSQP